MPYERTPTTKTPALVIVLVNVGSSMAEPFAGKRRLDVARDVLQELLATLVYGSTRGTRIEPRYRVAILAYSDVVEDLLDGAKSIDQVAHFGVPELHLGRGAEVAHGFARAEELLRAEFSSLWDCPPPLVCHLTDGRSTGADAEPAVRRIMDMEVMDGHVLVANLIVSDAILDDPIPELNSWPDIRPDSMVPGYYVRTLWAISSRLPDPHRQRLLEIGRPAVAPDARLLLPASDADLLWMASAFWGSAATPASPVAQRPLYTDENVQFTVYRPPVVQPSRWYTMLAFAHLSERRPDAPPEEPDPVREVERQAALVLGDDIHRYRHSEQDSSQAVPHEGELTFVPLVDEIEFNPPQASFLWRETVHRVDFRFSASSELDGQTAYGRLSVFLGNIVLAEVNLAIRVSGSHPEPGFPSHHTVDHARPYRRIFASYSHSDSAIVQEFERYIRTTGDDFVRDVSALRAGEVWQDQLGQLIDSADIFQLFWSWNSMRSKFVRQEWEYALKLDRDHFIRPVYWEEPLPESPGEELPPKSLRRLHFHCLQADAVLEVARRAEQERERQEALAAERQRLEALEVERRDREAREAARHEWEAQEAARREQDAREAARREQEAREAEQRERDARQAARREWERQEAERQERERQERADRERAEREQRERVTRERTEQERQERERRDQAAVAARQQQQDRERELARLARLEALERQIDAESGQPPQEVETRAVERHRRELARRGNDPDSEEARAAGGEAQHAKSGWSKWILILALLLLFTIVTVLSSYCSVVSEMLRS